MEGGSLDCTVVRKTEVADMLIMYAFPPKIEFELWEEIYYNDPISYVTEEELRPCI